MVITFTYTLLQPKKKEGKPWAATIARKASKVRAANIPPLLLLLPLHSSHLLTFTANQAHALRMLVLFP
jgi:hypothetical protein